MSITEDQLVDEKQLSKHLNVSLSTIRRWRYIDSGPPYKKMGNLVRYSIAEVDEYIKRHSVQPRRVPHVPMDRTK